MNLILYGAQYKMHWICNISQKNYWLINICHQFQNYNPKMSLLRDFSHSSGGFWPQECTQRVRPENTLQNRILHAQFCMIIWVVSEYNLLVTQIGYTNHYNDGLMLNNFWPKWLIFDKIHCIKLSNLGHS